MPERKRRPRDPNQLAYQTVQEATIQAEQPAGRTPATLPPLNARPRGARAGCGPVASPPFAIAKAAVAARWRKE